MVTSCRWAPVFQIEVQTSGRLSHWPVLLDGPVLFHEGRSGECQEPGNESDAGDVKDHLWLQDRWGFLFWSVIALKVFHCCILVFGLSWFIKPDYTQKKCHRFLELLQDYTLRSQNLNDFWGNFQLSVLFEAYQRFSNCFKSQVLCKVKGTGAAHACLLVRAAA